jgi:uncharacterized delta-60 repeat protein
MKTRLILSFAVTLAMLSALPASAVIAVDQTFNPGSGANGLVESTLVQPDGKILICGNFTSINDSGQAYIARLNPNGSLDTSFHAETGYWVRHMALQSDGKIIIGGFFTTVQGVPRNRIARLNVDGSLDTSFDPGSGCNLKIVPPDPWEPFVFAVAVQPDGKILIAGNFVTYNGVTNTGIVRVNSNGSRDTTFNVGAGINSWARYLMVQPNGQIMMTGWFTSYNNQPHSRMVLLNADGSADTSFHPDFGEQSAVYCVANVGNGQYIASGHTINTNNPGIWGRDIARLNADGSFDASFVGAADEKVESIKIQSDGKIVMGGYFSHVNGTPRANLARLNADGSLDNSFAPQADNFVWTIALQKDGKILATGGFTSIDGNPRKGVARFAPATTTLPPPPPIKLICQKTNTQTATFSGSTSYRVLQFNRGNPLKPGHRMALVSDFNHDGNTDFLWQQNTTGTVSIWFMNGTNIVGISKLNGQPATQGWRVAASGDFNGDGQRDLVLQKGANIKYWFLNGTNVESTLTVTNQMPAAWRLVGAGDFNGDGQLDLMWQHSAGYLAISHHTGTTFINKVVLQKRPIGWTGRAIADVTGDGKLDLILQNGSGEVVAWKIEGEIVTGTTRRGSTSAPWRIVGTTE